MRISHVCRVDGARLADSPEGTFAIGLADAQVGAGEEAFGVTALLSGQAAEMEARGVVLARRLTPLLVTSPVGASFEWVVYEGQISGSHVRWFALELPDASRLASPRDFGRAVLTLLGSLPHPPHVVHLHGETGVDCDEIREGLNGPALVQSVYEARSDEPTQVAAIQDADAVVVPCSGLWETEADPVQGVARALASRLKVYRVSLGIDEARWAPAVDSMLDEPFDASRLQGKEACKRALRSEAGLADRPEAPLLGVWTSAGDLGGRDGLAPVLGDLRSLDVQLILLPDPLLSEADPLVAAGTGKPGVWVAPDASERTVHRLLGAADAVILPDRVAVLGQRSRAVMRYAGVVVARRVQAHRDVLVEVDARSQSGGAFLFDEDTECFHAVHRLVRTYADSDAWSAICRANALMKWGWEKPLAQISEIYGKALAR